MNLWQRKLLAYLHDPPGKPFNIEEHREMAETLIRNAGFDPADVRWFFGKVCDHTAAAADRVVCPRSSVLHADFKGDAGSPFHHPLGVANSFSKIRCLARRSPKPLCNKL